MAAVCTLNVEEKLNVELGNFKSLQLWWISPLLSLFKGVWCDLKMSIGEEDIEKYQYTNFQEDGVFIAAVANIAQPFLEISLHSKF